MSLADDVYFEDDLEKLGDPVCKEDNGEASESTCDLFFTFFL